MKPNMGARMPAAWTNAVTAGAKSKSGTHAPAGTQSPAKVTARIDMSAEVAGAGLCPECRAPMTKAFANGHPVHVCHEHMIAIPIADEGSNPQEAVPEGQAQATAEKLEADDAGQRICGAMCLGLDFVDSTRRRHRRWCRSRRDSTRPAI